MSKLKLWAPGKELENQLNTVNQNIDKSGKGFIYQNETSKNVGDGTLIQIMSPPDFTGFIVRDNILHPLIFDAKETSDRLFHLHNVRQHQLNFLKKWASTNSLAEAYLVIWFKRVFKDPIFVHCVPILFFLKYLEDSGRKSVPYEDLAQFKRSLDDYLSLGI